MNKPQLTKEHTGAWIVHHGRKLVLDTLGASEFPAIDESAKAAELLVRLGQSTQTSLSMDEVKAVATSAGLNPLYELAGLLQVLEDQRLLDCSDNAVELIGITVRGALSNATDIYEDADPTSLERVSIDLADSVSQSPTRRGEIRERLGDDYQIASRDIREFLDRAVQIGFVDAEGRDDDAVLFNGNLFRRDMVLKANRVIESLKSGEQSRMREVAGMLQEKGCLDVETVKKRLSDPLLKKLCAAGVYDLNVVGNDLGDHVFVTTPDAFHKYVDPLVDDCFDMAKALVAALTYGMTKRSASTGRIQMLEALLGRLVLGHEVGPATAIGEDYRVLETKRVVKLRNDDDYPGRFYMRLLKREVGELALQVLTTGTANLESISLIAAPMTTYVGPEESRVGVRKSQSVRSHKQTRDILETLRSGLDF